jgi:hypothetical protein
MILFCETKLNNANSGRQVANSGLASAPEQGRAKTRKLNNDIFVVKWRRVALFLRKVGLKLESAKI